MSSNNHEKYSFLDPVINSNPFEFYKLLHEEKPVYQIPELGMFMITKYDIILRYHNMMAYFDSIF